MRPHHGDAPPAEWGPRRHDDRDTRTKVVGNGDAPAPEQRGQVLASIPRGEAEELRVSLDEYEGHPFVSIRVWAQGRDGQWWPVRGKGCTVRVRELGQVIAALGRAAKETGQAPRSRGAGKGAHQKSVPPPDPRPELPGLADAQDLASGDAALEVF